MSASISYIKTNYIDKVNEVDSTTINITTKSENMQYKCDSY